MILKSRFFDGLIVLVCLVVFLSVGAIRNIQYTSSLPFDRYLFSDVCAVLNVIVLLLLCVGVWSVRNGNKLRHMFLMKFALGFSTLFLVSYLMHHYFAGETVYRGSFVGRRIYLVFLISHILASAITLPLVLWTALNAIRCEFERHRVLAKYAYPIWAYVSLSGLIVYFFISPYYAR